MSQGRSVETNVGEVKGEANVRVVLPEPVSATTIVTPNRSTQYKSSSPVKVIREMLFAPN